MGWVDDQIKQRIINDDTVFSDAFFDLSGVVTGARSFTSGYGDDVRHIALAVEDILAYYKLPSRELPSNVTEFDEVLEYLLRPCGIMRRSVKLAGKWYRDAFGPMLARLRDGGVVAVLPRSFSGYRFINPATGKAENVGRANIGLFSDEALCFYTGFENRSLTFRDLLRFMLDGVSAGDCVFLAAVTLLVTLIGTLAAYANRLIFGTVITSGSMGLLTAVLFLLLGVKISSGLISAGKEMLLARIRMKINLRLESAVMMRVLSLPAAFFKNYNAGELSNRILYVTAISNTLADIVLSTGMGALFSVVYLAQIVRNTPSLTGPVLLIVLITCLTTVLGMFVQSRITENLARAESKENGIVFALISGIQKIKLAGAEKRAFARWAKLYKDVLHYRYYPRLYEELTLFVSAVGSAALFFAAAKTGVSVADYMAFQVAYGMLIGAFLEVSLSAVEAANIKPYYNMVRPILETVPEISPDKTVVTRLTGNIELNNVSFRYNESGRMILDNLSLRIRKGQYVAIVGASGCGKSTLMRIMLGFEKPLRGAVYYDGKDMEKLDLKSLRRSIGTVMQNDALLSGDIYSNIVLSAPWLTLDDAWEAARIAGIDEDIRRMPMQMGTVLSEGSGTISGGQRQRILIARAIAPRPRILFFDEATSALDNLTQKKVSDALASMDCTRVVIAHRLSTIRQCDRIIVLDQGRIIEDGTYDQLIAKDGFFANLVRRQQLSNNE